MSDPLVVYAVVFSTYEPAETAAIYRRREDAEADAKARNERSDWEPWVVEEWTVQETFDAGFDGRSGE